MFLWGAIARHFDASSKTKIGISQGVVGIEKPLEGLSVFKYLDLVYTVTSLPFLFVLIHESISMRTKRFIYCLNFVLFRNP